MGLVMGGVFLRNHPFHFVAQTATTERKCSAFLNFISVTKFIQVVLLLNTIMTVLATCDVDINEAGNH